MKCLRQMLKILENFNTMLPFKYILNFSRSNELEYVTQYYFVTYDCIPYLDYELYQQWVRKTGNFIFHILGLCMYTYVYLIFFFFFFLSL